MSSEALGLSPQAPVLSWIVSRHGPPEWSQAENAWVLTRYADVVQTLKHPAVSVREAFAGVDRLGLRSGRSFKSLSLLMSGILFSREPPFHTAGRRLVRQSMDLFSDRFSAEAIEEVVRDVLAAAPEDVTIDAMDKLFKVVPTTVMARALDFSASTVELIRRSAFELITILVPLLPLRVYSTAERTAAAVEEALREELRSARQTRTGNLWRMWALNEAEFGLREADLGAIVFFLFLAGVETTAALMGSALLFLLHSPIELRLLREDARRLRPFLEEVLRFAPPVRRVTRVALDDIEIGSTPIARGSVLHADIEQAHHDVLAFEEPGCLRVGGRRSPHLAFSGGLHACLGAGLSRLEAAVFLRAVLARWTIEAAGRSPAWEKHPNVRRLKHLDLVLRPAIR